MDDNDKKLSLVGSLLGHDDDQDVRENPELQQQLADKVRAAYGHLEHNQQTTVAPLLDTSPLSDVVEASSELPPTSPSLLEPPLVTNKSTMESHSTTSSLSAPLHAANQSSRCPSDGDSPVIIGSQQFSYNPDDEHLVQPDEIIQTNSQQDYSHSSVSYDSDTSVQDSQDNVSRGETSTLEDEQEEKTALELPPTSSSSNEYNVEHQVVYQTSIDRYVDDDREVSSVPERRLSDKPKKGGLRDTFRSISCFDKSMLVVSLVVWAGLMALVYVLIDRSRTSRQEDGTFKSPSDDPSSLLSYLSELSFDNGEALSNSSSPQYRAFEWLLKEEQEDFSNHHNDDPAIRYALTTLFYSTGGTRTWMDSFQFLQHNRSVCDWFSHRHQPCDNATLTHLDVSYNDLNGTLPGELGFLTDLITLNMAGGPRHKLYGTLPSELQYLSQLQELKLPNQALTGTVPSNLTNVRTVDLAGNQFSGNISTIVSWPNLIRLSLQNNQFSGPLPDNWNMPFLKTLGLANNQLTGTLPENTVHQLRDLVFVELQDNQLEGALLTNLGNWTELRTLRLGGNLFNGTIPHTWDFDDLKELDLSRNQLSGAVPAALAALNPQIKVLELHGNQALHGRIPDTFADLMLLQKLTLYSTNVTDFSAIACERFNETVPAIAVDCEKLPNCGCCNFCCRDNQCRCKHRGTELQWMCY